MSFWGTLKNMFISYEPGDDIEDLMDLQDLTVEAFGRRPKFAKPEKETPAKASKREKERKAAFAKAKELMKEKGIISSHDLDINAMLAGPSTVGKPLGFIHSGELDANLKLIKKQIKKQVKKKKKTMKKKRKGESPEEQIERIDKELADLEKLL